MNQWFRGIIRGKTRIVIAWVFAAALCFWAREYPQPPGMIVCFLGATLRYWASGFLRKDSRPAVGGPYRYIRNPLYLGTYLMAVGTAWAIENYWLLGILTVGFALIYHYIILDEETKLMQIFGEPYLTYKKHVARFFPIPYPALPLPFKAPNRNTLLAINPESSHLNFSTELAKKNKAMEAYWSFMGLIGGCALIALIWKNVPNG